MIFWVWKCTFWKDIFIRAYQAQKFTRLHCLQSNIAIHESAQLITVQCHLKALLGALSPSDVFRYAFGFKLIEKPSAKHSSQLHMHTKDFANPRNRLKMPAMRLQQCCCMSRKNVSD